MDAKRLVRYERTRETRRGVKERGEDEDQITR